jgi:hypothetical protein
MEKVKKNCESTGYREGCQPRRYGCQEYSLEMQLLQLQKRCLQVTSRDELAVLERRVREIEEQLGM